MLLKQSKKNIARLEKKLNKGKSLSLKEQKEILRELKARPYFVEYREELEPLCETMDLYNFDELGGKFKRTFSLELDNGKKFEFEVKTIVVN